MKKSYKYQYQTYSIQLLMMEKKELRKKLFLTLNWGIPNL